MKIKFALLMLLLSGEVLSKDCPSKLPSNLNEYDSFAWGVEGRLLYNGIPGDKSGSNGYNYHKLKFGIKSELDLFLSDNSTIVAEIDYKQHNRGNKSPNNSGETLRANQFLYDYDTDKLSSIAGLQMHSYSSSILIDQRFIGESLTIKKDRFNAGIFVGASQKDMFRALNNSFFHSYSKTYQSWKSPISNKVENYAIQLHYSYLKYRPFKIKGYFLSSLPQKESLRSNALAIMIAGPIKKRTWSFHFEGMVFENSQHDILPGMLLSSRIQPVSWLELDVGLLTKISSDKQKKINPIYENIAWGIIKKYSIYSDHVAKLKIDFKVNDAIKPFIHYYAQSTNFSTGDLTDELDTGLEYNFKGFRKKDYFLRLSYIYLEFAGDKKNKSGIHGEFRIIF
jgi:hypothetical protein